MIKINADKKTKAFYLYLIALVFIIGAFRFRRYIDANAYNPSNAINFFLFCIAFLMWIYDINRRILQKMVKLHLIIAGALMIFWFELRTLKYEFLPRGHIISRHIVYSYYLFIIFIFLLIFFSAMHIEKKDKGICKKCFCLYAIAISLSAAIMTNDIHQKFFYYIGGIQSWTDEKIKRGFIFYLVIIFIVMLLMSTIYYLVKNYLISSNRMNLWRVFIPLICWIIYTILYISDFAPTKILIFSIKSPEASCLVMIAFVETLINNKLLPSNNRYLEFFNMSSISAIICDSDYKIHFSSKNSTPISVAMMKKAQSTPIKIDESSLLTANKINGGVSYYIKDISSLNMLNKRLSEINENLSKENEYIKKESIINEKLIHIKQKTKLYQSISTKLKTKIDKVNEIIDNISDQEEDFIKQMKLASVIGSYIKRASNLIITGEYNSHISFDELQLAFAESLEYFKLYGLNSYLSFNTYGELHINKALAIYEIFQEIMESIMLYSDLVMINLTNNEDNLRLRIGINSPKESLDDFSKKEISGKLLENITYSYDNEDDTAYLTVSL